MLQGARQRRARPVRGNSSNCCESGAGVWDGAGAAAIASLNGGLHFVVVVAVVVVARVTVAVRVTVVVVTVAADEGFRLLKSASSHPAPLVLPHLVSLSRFLLLLHAACISL